MLPALVLHAAAFTARNAAAPPPRRFKT